MTATKDVLAAPTQKLAAAHQRVAQVKERRRGLQLEGQATVDAIQAALFEAGKRGEEPDISELRDRVAAIQAAIQDTHRVEAGAQAGVQEAQNLLAQTRLKHAPNLQRDLIARAEKLKVERAHLEHELALLREREEDVRADFRRLAAAVPAGDAHFAEEKLVPPESVTKLVPTVLVTEPHPGLAAHVVDENWPTWFQAVVHQSRAAYALKERRREELVT